MEYSYNFYIQWSEQDVDRTFCQWVVHALESDGYSVACSLYMQPGTDHMSGKISLMGESEHCIVLATEELARAHQWIQREFYHFMEKNTLVIPVTLTRNVPLPMNGRFLNGMAGIYLSSLDDTIKKHFLDRMYYAVTGTKVETLPQGKRPQRTKSLSLSVCPTCGGENRATAKFCRCCSGGLTISPQTFVQSQPFQGVPVVGGKYQIIRSLGTGGMGSVHLAEDLSCRRRVALKELILPQDPREAREALTQFRQEATILASLSHQNIPIIYEHFTDAGRYYIAMTFIEGQTLEERVETGNLVPLRETMNIAQMLAGVLCYLHARQPAIIFRDLKPANVMQTANGDVYLIDFGIARNYKPGQSKDTLAFGSPGYAPLEQYGGRQTTTTADVYALARVIKRLLIGEDPTDFLPTIYGRSVLDPTYPIVTQRLEQLLKTMVSPSEDQRPQTRVVLEELQAIHQLILSPPLVQSVQIPSGVSFTIVHAPNDSGAVNNMRLHLKTYIRKGLLREVLPFESPQIAFLILSPHFLANDECEQFLQHLAKLYQDKTCLIIPIRWKQCAWQQEWYGHLQGFPYHASVIHDARNEDQEWYTIAEAIAKQFLS